MSAGGGAGGGDTMYVWAELNRMSGRVTCIWSPLNTGATELQKSCLQHQALLKTHHCGLLFLPHESFRQQEQDLTVPPPVVRSRKLIIPPSCLAPAV